VPVLSGIDTGGGERWVRISLENIEEVGRLKPLRSVVSKKTMARTLMGSTVERRSSLGSSTTNIRTVA